MKKNIFAVTVALSINLALGSLAFATIIPPPGPLPTDKSECKNGGWQNFGGVFKNQGDCVSFVATGGKNPPSGI